jgi:two-component system, cell cycle response regulator DivK
MPVENALSRTVLVVDDDAVVRRILAELVASRGYEVVEATDGDDAWMQLKHTRIAVVISDLQMPRCDGYELCRRIRAEPALRHVRVVIVTGCHEPPDRQHLNCDALLHKPIAVEALLNEIADSLHRRSAPSPHHPSPVKHPADSSVRTA